MVSIIIVHYNVKKELFACLQSLVKAKNKSSYEIIIVDNDEKKVIEKELKQNFPGVIYISNTNKGFGQGNNVGAKNAKGNYLFFLNPDTKIFKNCIDYLVSFLDKNKNTAIVAPMLYDEANKLYPQGANELTPLSAIFSFSFVHKLFPKNTIAKKYWMTDIWDRSTPHAVASIPGTAFVMRKDIFEKIQGFDENFFMYFEEHDLCRRVKALGWDIVMLPQAKVYHALGKSSAQLKDRLKIFNKSRFYYFKKHFGLLSALLTESIMRFGKNTLLLSGIAVLAVYAVVYRLNDLMTFIGDQGWYYLSARDMILSGKIPLVGIASSHPWLHQGAFWTYMLAPFFVLFNFNPISGAYLSLLLHFLTLVFLYNIATNLFSNKIALIATVLYATAPLIVMHARMPYHTTPIALLSLLLYYALYKWIKGFPGYFPISIFLLATLYNFETATFLLTIVFIIVLGFGIWKRTAWVKKILQPKIILLSFLAYILPMTPMLLYDMNHGYPQTVKFLTWIVYKLLLLFGYTPLKPEIGQVSLKEMILFLGNSYTMLTYVSAVFVTFAIGVFSLLFILKNIRDQISAKIYKPEIILVVLLLVISIVGIVATKTTSDAYLSIVFPFVILIHAIFFSALIEGKPNNRLFVYVIVSIIALSNTYALISNDYFITRQVEYKDKVAVVKKIISEADGNKYNLVGQGVGSSHESFTMNYEYLAWWYGNGPSSAPQELYFIIEETPQGIQLKKEKKI
jgi:GT2 family glycosyltransferase